MASEETSLPIRFPDPREETYSRSQEFRRLSPEKRLEYLLQVFEMGMFFLRKSPKRQFAEQSFLKREAEWQRIQKELFSRSK